jgi:hypothetical protein
LFTVGGPSSPDFLYKIICFFSLFENLAKRSLYFWVITQLSMVFENNYRKVPSPRKIYRIAPKASNLHIFPTTTPNSMILVPGFS